MDKKILTRSYLETLSSSDLVSLADDYGIDIPDNLSRRFIIGELLEIAEGLGSAAGESGAAISELSELSDEESSALPDSLKNKMSDALPLSFNESEIDFVFRNPVWVYVFWDIKAADLAKMDDDDDFDRVVLRVSYFDSFEATVPTKSFDVNVSAGDHGQFVMVAVNKQSESAVKFLRIDLVALYDGKSDTIAISKKMELPVGSDLLGTAMPGRDFAISPVNELSGMRSALKNHYQFQRESFV